MSDEKITAEDTLKFAIRSILLDIGFHNTGLTPKAVEPIVKVISKSLFGKEFKWIFKEEWISVKDRPPKYTCYSGSEEFAHVIAYTKGGLVCEAMYINGEWEILGSRGVLVTHWMSLPKPPDLKDEIPALIFSKMIRKISKERGYDDLAILNGMKNIE